MLEVRDLKKYYKTKGGVEVHALDGVSIQFPETGMVFLLGKSGSGKSTLLNVSGGLDKPDSGEIIVKGKSSKDFSQSDFDSYRNTFIGFVFQEYNILNEFNIETNIALALELQGKKNDKKAVEDLLKQVDLEGMGKRKPNTLSGGQKQRIAIARALIKNPEIIMADEPTGALDSNTGKQVLDTLKKLSETKLIIIVSHDRDFAEEYADRIIELKDGKVISDDSKSVASAEQISSNIRKVGDGTLQIKDIDSLSESELKDLLKSLKGKGEVIISNNESNVNAFKKIAKINDDGAQQCFKDTNLKAINIKSYDGSKTKFIKSKLPAKHALKMGASNLKIKPGRLVFTMFLSVIAFSMFGILSTLMLYNEAFSHAKGLQEEAYESLVMSKNYTVHSQYIRIDKNGEEEAGEENEYSRQTNISKTDVANLNNNSLGLEFAGYYKKDINFSGYLHTDSNLDYYKENDSLYGLCDCGEDFLLRQRGFEKLAGEYPKDDTEIALSDYVFELFKKCDYSNPDGVTTKQINTEDDLIGQQFNVMLNNTSSGLQKTFEFTISGIYKTDNALRNSKYEILKEANHTNMISNKEYQAILESYQDVYKSSFAGLGYVSTDFYDNNKSYLMPENNSRIYINTNSLFGLRFLDSSTYKYFKNTTDDKSGYYPNEYDSLPAITSDDVENYKSYFKFFDINGNELAAAPSIAPDETYVKVNSYWFKNAFQNMISYSTGNMFARYDENGELSYYPENNKGYNNEQLYINYSTKKVSFVESSGYVPVENEILLNKDEEVIAFSKYVYLNNEYNDFRNEYDESHQNYVRCWFDENDNFVGTEFNFREISLDHFYYDRESKKVYLEDQIEKLVEGKVEKIVLKDDHNVILEQFNSYYLTNNGEPASNNVNNKPLRKGLFVNKTTGEVSLNKQTGSVFTDNYYKDTNGKNYFGLKVYNCYSYTDDSNQKHYGYRASFCDLGYVDMTWEYSKSMRYIDSLSNKEDVLKAIVKFYAVGKDSWQMEELKILYGDIINFDQVAMEPLTSNDLKVLFVAMNEFEAMNSAKDEYMLSYKDPVGVTTRGQMVYELKISGVFIVDNMVDCYQDLLVNNVWKDRATNPNDNYVSSKNVDSTKYQIDNNAQYGGVICMSDKTVDQIKFMMKGYDDDSFYEIENNVSTKIGYVTDLLGELKLIFLIIGSSMALFSGLMLLNFISTSISNKQKEIGILRAVGARGSDVFKIFFSESAIICLICVAFSIVISGIGCYIFNTELAENLTIQFFEFGIVNVAIIFAIAFVVGLLGTLFPVIRASRRPPVESIRAL